MAARFAATIGVLFGSLASPATATSMELLVPAYFYPAAGGSDWDRLAAAAKSGVTITAIMNPASGPGDMANADYMRAIRAVQDTGGRVLGYVPSGYMGRAVNPGSSCLPANGRTYTSADIIGCAARYQKFYHIDGIFIDEMGPPKSGAPEGEVVAFYTAVYDGLKALDPRWTVMGNPGTAAPETLLRQKTKGTARAGDKGGADVLVTFENRAANYAGAKPTTYVARHPASRFANILIETGAKFDIRATVALATARHVGYFYATDRLLPNPYDKLPTYWDALLEAPDAKKSKG